MPPEAGAPDDPKEWLRRARSNLARSRADARLPDVYLEDLCFDAQQAAEKAIKAVLISLGIPFPYVHDLTALLSVLDAKGEPVPDRVREAGRLTRFAVATRYPTLTEPVTAEEHSAAVAIAQAVIEWARERVAPGTVD